MTQINNFDQYVQRVRLGVAAVNPNWDSQTQEAAVHVFEIAVVTLGRTITDSVAAEAWVTSTTSTVVAALV